MPITPLSEILEDDFLNEGRIKINDNFDTVSSYVNTLIPSTEKGSVDGVASLDGAGKIPVGQIPSIAITAIYEVADVTERDGLSPDQGDIAVLVDGGSGEPSTQIYDGSSWVIISNNTVTSVNGETGDVTLGLNSLSDVDLTTPPNDGETLVYNQTSGNFEAGPGGGGASTLSELTDISLVDSSPFDVLVNLDGSSWGNIPFEAAVAPLSNVKKPFTDEDNYEERIEFSPPEGFATLTQFRFTLTPTVATGFNYVDISKSVIPASLEDVTIDIDREPDVHQGVEFFGDVTEFEDYAATEFDGNIVRFMLPRTIWVDRQEEVDIRIRFPSASEDYTAAGATPGMFTSLGGDAKWYFKSTSSTVPEEISIGLADPEEAKVVVNTKYPLFGTEYISFNGDGFHYIVAEKAMDIVSVTEAGTGNVSFSVDSGAGFNWQPAPDEQPLDEDSTVISLYEGDVLRVELIGCTSWKAVSLYWRYNMNNTGGFFPAN